MLELKAVSKRYGRAGWVLRDVDFSLPAGETAAITGPNGSGKSTMLRLLAGLSRPTRGRVTGRPDVVGFVPERFPPNDRMSAAAYLTHLGRIRGLPTEAAGIRADELLERLALAGGKNRPIRSLSKGNAQKVSIAQALLVAPKLLVLDEPWSGLDVSAHGVLRELIVEAAASGATVVISSHREALPEGLSARTWLLAKTRILPAPPRAARAAAELIQITLAATFGEPINWPAVTGVESVRRRPAAVTLGVQRASSDSVLLLALQAGWSVLAVQPAPDEAPPGPAPGRPG